MSAIPDDLDRTFSIGDRVRVAQREGHPIIRIITPSCRCEIALQGAQLLSWQPAGHADVLWCADLPKPGSGKAIRGGIPVCWPWFGPHPTDAAQPQHGLARTADWRLVETAEHEGGVHVAFELSSAGAVLRLDCVAGAQLQVSLTTRNVSNEALVITEALHTYFHVGDVASVAVQGLDGSAYRDNTDGGREKLWRGTGPFDRETIAVFERAPDVATIEDPVLRRRIHIARTGGQSTVAWHPGANIAPLKDVQPETAGRFLCIESGNVWSSALSIPPGNDHCLSVTYKLTAM